jgi:O-antigen/teichoic acid export membrane protein
VKFWFEVAEVSGARIYSVAVAVVVMFFTARVLGPEGRGTLVAAMTWASLFGIVAGLSLGTVAHHRIQIKNEENWLPETFGTLLVTGIAMSLIAYLVIIALAILSDGAVFKGIPPTILALAFVTLPFLVLEDYGAQLITAAGRIRSYSVAQLIGRSVGLIGVIVGVVVLGLGVAGALIGQIVGQAIVVAMVLGVLWKLAGRRIVFNATEMRALLKGGMKLHLNTVGAFLLNQANILMLNHYSTKDQVGWYQLAFQLIVTMLIIPQGAAMIFFSRMAKLGPDRLWPEQKRLGLQVLGVMILLSIVAYYVAPFVIVTLAGPEFEPSVEIFRWLLPATVGMTLAQMMAPQWIGRGIFLLTAILTISSAIVIIGLNSVLIPMYGAMGAVWGMLIAYFGMVVVVQTYFAFWCERKYRASLKYSR